MKKYTLFVFLVLALCKLQAKSVLFSVDLGTSTVSPNGVHLSGDFQAAIGFGPNWDPGTLSMLQSGTSSIYTIVINLPAFKKYEFRFVNGDQTYEAEFVPDESRVGWIGNDYSDNRWIYVDSLNTDTSKIGAIRFGENAPSGKKLLRFKVDLSDAASISPNGIHVGTSYQTNPFDPSKIRLHSLNPYVFEIINFVDAGQVDYLFYNGNTNLGSETVPLPCQVSGKRSLTVMNDTVLPNVCFSSCGACLTVGRNEISAVLPEIKVFPNPASETIWVESTHANLFTVEVMDISGHLLFSQGEFSGETKLNISSLQKGMYFIKVKDLLGLSNTQVLLVN